MTIVRRIVVTPHAARQALARGHYPGDLAMVRRRILRDVAAALVDGRVSSVKPLWATLHGETHFGEPMRLSRRKRFVWNEAETLGWIVKSEADADVVVTALHRVRSKAEAAA